MKNGTRIFASRAAIILTLAALSAQPQAVFAQSGKLSATGNQVKYVGNFPGLGLEEYSLKSNSLRIILLKRDIAPVVTVNMVYHVGSRNEAVGYTGSTHFLEHMMFKGTAKHDPLKKNGLDDLLKGCGGINNATTSYDRTNYYEVVPKDSLGLCLEIEADRMRHLLLRESDRQAEMTVVRNELERGEDEPAQLLENGIFATAFREHPYHHPVIGWRSDVEGVPTSRLRQFYQDFYWPNNATLVIVGDFDKAQALALIEKNFGAIKSSSKAFPKVYTKEPAQEGERRFIVQRGKELPRVMLAWHTPRGLDPATFPLDVMAKVLGGQSKSSRLYKALVEPGLASECYASNYSLYDPGLFMVSATVQPGVDPALVEARLKDEVKAFTRALVPADELELARVSLAKRFRLSLSDGMNLAQSITEGIALGDWRFWANYPGKVLTVSSKAVKEQAQKIFSDRNLSCGYYLPADFKTEGLARSASSSLAEKTTPEVGADNTSSSSSSSSAGSFNSQEKSPNEASTKESPASFRKAAAPKGIAGRVERFILPNGLTCLLCPSNTTGGQKLPGTVALSVKIRSGDYFAPAGHPATPGLTAEMLPYATRSFKKEILANNLEKLGISLDVESSSFFQDFGAEVSAEDLPQLLTIAASLLREPDFSQENLDLVKKLSLAALQEKSTDTTEVAWNALLNALYKPGFVYHAPPFARQMEEVKNTTLDDIREFHRSQYIAPNMVLCLIGDFNPQSLKAQLKEKFGGLAGGSRSPITLKSDGLTDKYLGLKKGLEIRSELSDKANIDVSIGKPVALSFKSKDYLPAMVGNAVLGYDSFACRLAPLRDQYGLTYSVSSRISQPQFPYSPWSIDYSVNPENLGRSLKILNRLVNDFQTSGVSQAEVSKEKRHLAGTFLVGLRNIQAIGRKLCEYEQIGLPLTNIDDFAQRLQKTNVENVNAAIKKYFQLDKTVSSMSGSFKDAPAGAADK